MSTFYVLPSRPRLGESFARYLKILFPGLDWDRGDWGDLADVLTTAARQQPDVYLVYREELPPEPDWDSALADGFGAERGDEVVEVQLGARPGEATARRWVLGAGTN